MISFVTGQTVVLILVAGFTRRSAFGDLSIVGSVRTIEQIVAISCKIAKVRGRAIPTTRRTN
jgi:hypothetical protein